MEQRQKLHNEQRDSQTLSSAVSQCYSEAWNIEITIVFKIMKQNPMCDLSKQDVPFK